MQQTFSSSNINQSTKVILYSADKTLEDLHVIFLKALGQKLRPVALLLKEL
jgi:hypothetical protein